MAAEEAIPKLTPMGISELRMKRKARRAADPIERQMELAEGWLSANPATGKPYHQEEIRKRYIRKACIAAEIGSDISWHTFRHSYRSWLVSHRLFDYGLWEAHSPLLAIS
jgi:site-specific recombinase XerC